MSVICVKSAGRDTADSTPPTDRHSVGLRRVRPGERLACVGRSGPSVIFQEVAKDTWVPLQSGIPLPRSAVDGPGGLGFSNTCSAEMSEELV